MVDAAPRHAGNLHLCEGCRSHGRDKSDPDKADFLLREEGNDHNNNDQPVTPGKDTCIIERPWN